MKGFSLRALALIIAFISLVPLAYKRLQEQPHNQEVSSTNYPKTINSFKNPNKALIEVNGHKYDGYAKYAYIEEAFRRGQIDINEPPLHKLYEVGHVQRELDKAMLASAGKRTNSDVFFTERGPSNFPGRTRGLIVDITDPTERTWFGASIGGGIWRTTNAGQTWVELTAGMSNLATTWIVQAKSNPNVMYATTGEKIFTSISGSNGAGLMKSTNKGNSWTFLPSTANEEFANMNRVIVDPANENILLVATAEKMFFDTDGAKNCIFRSEDGGNTWQKVYSSNYSIPQIIADPKDFSKQYATINDGTLIRSKDGGKTWSEPITMFRVPISSQSGSFDQLIFRNPDFGRVELAIAPNNTSIIYGSLNYPAPNTANSGAAYNARSELLISLDAGETWGRATDSSMPQIPNWLSNQGNYDNTIMVSPLNDSIVYMGGVGMEQYRLSNINVSDTLESLDVLTKGADDFFLVHNAFADAGTEISRADFVKVEIRFGVKQKAHRFTVPEGATSGVPNFQYTYRDYVEVPFQVWDVKNNRQLMASFRDNNANGIFDITRSSNESRSYIFVNNIDYSETPNSNIATNGGHIYKNSYLVWLITPTTAPWSPDAISGQPTITLEYKRASRLLNFGKFTKVANPYERVGNNYVGPNFFRVLHPDHHNLVPINVRGNSFSILNANDGGIFISDTANIPGVKNNGWHFVSRGYNTATYYGADKSPTSDRFIGGPQDQSTNLSPKDVIANATTEYREVGTGDGFEVIWHATDPEQIIWSSYNNFFIRTENGGDSFFLANAGLENDGPFVSRLSNNPAQPDVLYAVGARGVYKSTNFGRNWSYKRIDDPRWSFWSAVDVEVSQASPQVVWAGGAMRTTPNPFNIFVSKDGGETFAATSNFGNLGVSTGIYSHPFDFNTAYVLFAIPGVPKVLRTKDLGQSWTDITKFENGQSTNGFPDVAAFSLLVMPHDTAHIWVGTEIGIVESLDGGQTWSLLNHPDFRAVSVWDMKIKGDQIVLATHGRGIWTASISALANAPQPVIVFAPVLNNAQQNLNEFSLAVNIDLKAKYDSVHVLFDGQKVFEIVANQNTGNRRIDIPLTKTGQLALRAVAYKSGLIYPTEALSLLITPLAAVATKYSTRFDDRQSDWTLDRFAIGQPLGFTNNILHTSPNPYPEANSLGLQSLNLIAVLNVPIIVANEKATISFREVVLVEVGEPGTKFGDQEFWDYVVVEASKNGNQWVPLVDGYDSNDKEVWRTAYSQNQSGRPALFQDRTINIRSKFAAGDTIQIRFRLFSDPFSNAWGWGIDDLYIQEDPPLVSGLNDPATLRGVNVYPVPSFGYINLEIKNVLQGELSLRIIDYSGKEVLQQKLANQSGTLEERINLEKLPWGMYIVEIDNGKERVTKKIMKF